MEDDKRESNLRGLLIRTGLIKSGTLPSRDFGMGRMV